MNLFSCARHVLFKDRQRAGVLLSQKLTSLKGSNSLVLGLARGGVVVAKSVAHLLALPYDVIVVKKLSSSYNPEYALGAVAPDGVFVVDWPAAHRVGVDEDFVNTQIVTLSQTIKEKLVSYRKGKKPLEVKGRTAIIVDDGAATGATMEAAIRWLRKKKAKKIIVALPVAPPETIARLRPEADDLVVYETPRDLSSVAEYYESFPQIEDTEVIKLLRATP